MSEKNVTTYRTSAKGEEQFLQKRGEENVLPYYFKFKRDNLKPNISSKNGLHLKFK